MYMMLSSLIIGFLIYFSFFMHVFIHILLKIMFTHKTFPLELFYWLIIVSVKVMPFLKVVLLTQTGRRTDMQKKTRTY